VHAAIDNDYCINNYFFFSCEWGHTKALCYR